MHAKGSFIAFRRLLSDHLSSNLIAFRIDNKSAAKKDTHNALFYARVPGLREHEESLSLLTRSSNDFDNLSNEKEKLGGTHKSTKKNFHNKVEKISRFIGLFPPHTNT